MPRPLSRSWTVRGLNPALVVLARSPVNSPELGLSLARKMVLGLACGSAPSPRINWGEDVAHRCWI
jgi:hypothetical protein